MLRAEVNGSMVWGDEVSKQDGPFLCPECSCDVIVKKGKVRIHHFSHLPEAECRYSNGETELHRKAKRDIYEALSSYRHVELVEVERRLRHVRADIYLESQGRRFAIEVQRSVLTTDDAEQRTEEYRSLGIHVLWLALVTQVPDSGDTYRPKQWERWLRDLYGGRVYYWAGHGDSIAPVEYMPDYSWVEQTDFGGGYWRRLKQSVVIAGHPHIPLRELRRCTRQKGAVPGALILREADAPWFPKNEPTFR
tara:strand:- start:1412 stop:2161 length:750 start_codon:yes stop_codon:yes gene_type:complete